MAEVAFSSVTAMEKVRSDGGTSPEVVETFSLFTVERPPAETTLKITV